MAEINRRINERAPFVNKIISRLGNDVARAINAQKDPSNTEKGIALSFTIWAQHGWFAGFSETPLEMIHRAAAMFHRGHVDEANKIASEHFENTAPEFLEKLCERHPSRNQILRDAFEAHFSGKYTLSIPVLLCQADGIGCEFFEVDSIYTESDKRFAEICQKLEQKLSIDSPDFFRLVIGIANPINANKKKRQQSFRGLNRHTIIHGESTSYPTKENSLKAISWIQFVSTTTENF